MLAQLRKSNSGGMAKNAILALGGAIFFEESVPLYNKLYFDLSLISFEFNLSIFNKTFQVGSN